MNDYAAIAKKLPFLPGMYSPTTIDRPCGNTTSSAACCCDQDQPGVLAGITNISH